jgi:outer membrane protein assembly factor BamB
MISAVTTTDTAARRRRARTAIIVVSLLTAVAGSIALLTNGPTEQATTKGVTATLRLPGSPDFAVSTPRGLWVSIHGTVAKQNIAPSGQLLRINLATGTVQQTVRLSGSTPNLALDGNRLIADPGIAGTSTAGAPPGELIAIDTRTGSMLARRHQQIGGGPMAIGDGTLWEIQEASARTPTTLEQLNPTTRTPIAPPRALSATSAVLGLAWGEGHVWATEHAGEVLRIDPGTRTITRAHVGGFPIGIAVAGGSVWVIDNANATVIRLDPSTLRVIGQPLSLPGGANFYLGASDGYLFVADDSDGTVTRIDTQTGETAGAPIRIARASTIGFGSAYAIAPAGTSIWATSPSSDTISRIQTKP